jgi:hypothetical protein
MSKIENRVSEKLLYRAETGFSKYGVTMEREDLSQEEWLVHLQEELLDGAVYIEKLLDVLRNLNKQTPSDSFSSK